MRGTGVLARLGASHRGVWAIRRIVSPMQRVVYRLSRGRMSLTGAAPVLLLTTTGRRTGKPRTVPVFFLTDRSDIIVCNVRPPGERVNPWVLNLRENSAVQLELRGARWTGLARPASPAEVARYWPRLVAIWPAFAEFFASGGERSIFVVRSPATVADPPARPGSTP